jgi:hypothetical protein
LMINIFQSSTKIIFARIGNAMFVLGLINQAASNVAEPHVNLKPPCSVPVLYNPSDLLSVGRLFDITPRFVKVVDSH